MKSEPAGLPTHIAIVMDGNGRWAETRNRPRTFGHQAGQKALRKFVDHCGVIGVRELTVFAFSSENWNRPAREVNRLMELFMRALDKETKELDENDVRVRFIGHIKGFSPELQDKVAAAEARTAGNSRMTLNVAANYGGRWDIVNAAREIALQVEQGSIRPDDIDENLFSAHTTLSDSPAPDLFSRTGGDMRISNVLLGPSAHTEFYLSSVLWPDFSPDRLDEAIAAYQARERRFGLTGQQTRKKSA